MSSENMQEIILIILVIASVAFMGRRFYMQYKSDAGCATGCDSCTPTKKEVKLPGHFKN